MDLLIADLHLPGPTNGLALLAQVRTLHPTTGLVLMSGSGDARVLAEVHKLGVMGFLPKSLEPAAWAQALDTVLSGEPWFPDRAAVAEGLTRRQGMILERVAQGQTNKLIARELGISDRTIKYHLSEVFERLNASSRAEAVARASAKGWIGLPGATR